MGYKEKLDFGEFTLEVRQPDHGEPHVHATRGRDFEVIIGLKTLTMLEYPKGFSMAEVRVIIGAVKANRKYLGRLWREFNGY